MQQPGSLEKLQEICDKGIPTNNKMEAADIEDINGGENTGDGSATNGNGLNSHTGLFTCHLCTFSSASRDDFNNHVNSHYEFRCQKCDFMTKDEDEYR